MPTRLRKTIIGGVVVLLLAAAVAYFFSELRPVRQKFSETVVFEIKPGDGFREIASRLADKNLIRSAGMFELFAVFTGRAYRFQPGLYELSAASSSFEILGTLTPTSKSEISVKIPDGASVYEVDKILSDNKILPRGSLISFVGEHQLEGRLYPDTYRFLPHSLPEDVSAKFLSNFEKKAAPLLEQNQKNFRTNLILASLVQKEVSDSKDQRLVAGILKKRLTANFPLQVDATICYLKKLFAWPENISCYPLTQADFKIDSVYNTYLYSGLPPGPIGSPTISAIQAVFDPLTSPYWYYLSDPRTGKTIFSKTLEEQSANRSRYLN